MDFLDPKKRRSHQIRLYVGYFLITLLILLTASLLFLQAKGFNFNFKTGTISQSGMLFIDSRPGSADIILNGEHKGTTNRRLLLPAETYNLEIKLDGYRSWRRSFALAGGKIQRFNYPFLFPTELKSRERQLYASAPPAVSQSPDRRWMVVRLPDRLPIFSLVDLSSETTPAAQLVLPGSVFFSEGENHAIKFVEWSTDNRHLVVEHVFDGGKEFVLVDIEKPELSLNLTRHFAPESFDSIKLMDKKFDKYYLHDSRTKTLKTADLTTKAVSLIIQGVIQFTSHGDNIILYATNEGADKGRTLIRMREGSDTFTLRNFLADDSYLLDLAQFEGKWYVVAGAVSEGKIYVLRNPTTALRRAPDSDLIPAATLRIGNPQYASFSANARFVAVQSGSSFSVYDAENGRNIKYNTGYELAKNATKATWMDGHRLTIASQGKVRVFDFDGANKQELTSSYNHLPALFDRDFTAMFSFADSELEGRSALIRTELLVVPDGN